MKTQPFPAIIPLTIRGETGGSRALLKGRRSSRTSQTHAEQTFTVYIVCKYSAGRYKRHGIERFAYILTGNILRCRRSPLGAFPSRVGGCGSGRSSNRALVLLSIYPLLFGFDCELIWSDEP